MNWDAAGAIAETLAALAVLATLIYLARQMKQNTLMLRSQARRQVLEGVTADTERMMSESNFEITFKLLQGESLSDKEEAKYTALALSYFGNLEIQYHEIQDGTLDPMFEKTLRFRLSLLLSNERLRAVWRENRNFLTDEFCAYVDEFIESGLAGVAKSDYWHLDSDF